MYITGEISPTVEGLRLTGGNAAGLDGADDCDAGGGVYMSIRMGVFSNNWVFSNTAACGGGLYLSGGAPTLSNNTVMSNTANGNFNRVGGGLYLYWSDAALAGNTISFNAANYGGGGLFVHGGAPTFTGNTVAFNIAVNGGGLYCEEALIATLTGNTISFNTATEYGGGLSMYSAATLSGNTVFSNTAAQAGGGLYLDFGGSMLDATLVNNLVADNQANSQGSGLYLVKVPLLRLVHTTITRNRGGDGSGVYVDLESSLIMTNTILVGQTVGITVTSGSAATLEGTLWGSGAWANGANWGGAGTIIMGTINVLGDPDFVNPAGGNYHLGAGSAAVDAANQATDVVKVAGYCMGVTSRDGVTQMVYLSKTLTVQGDWNTAFTERNVISYATTLDAQRQGRVFYITGNITPTIEGLRLTGGNAVYGGGLYLVGGAPTLSGNTIMSNTVILGGGLSMGDSTATLSGNTFYSNTANDGGGLAVSGGAPTLSRNLISSNNASDLGGGLYFSFSASTLNGNVVMSNTAAFGGAEYGIQHQHT